MSQEATTGPEALRYDRPSIALHWLVAGTVALLWTMGRLTGYLPKGPLRLDIWSMHVVIGLALAGLVIARIGWRLGGATRPPLTGPPAARITAATVHAALYGLMIAIVVSGVANTFGHGFPLFGVWRFPRLWSRPFQSSVGEWHDLAANVIAAVAGLHAAAALYHQFILKDGGLRRMWAR